MAFIISGGTVISFADADDVHTIDQRVFEANEGLTDAIVEEVLIRGTTRIIQNFGASDWWRSYYIRMSGGTYDPLIYNSLGLLPIPDPDPNKILARQADFTDLCVYYSLSYYLLPKIADFSKEDNAERAKIGFNQEKYNFRFEELINSGDWYDFGGDGVVQSNEKLPGHMSLRRVR